jgi:hypothetical protein
VHLPLSNQRDAMNGTSENLFRISDLFVVTAVVAAFVTHELIGSLLPGLVALCLTLIAVWNRPLIFRFWICGMLGFGMGMFAAGVYDLVNFPMPRAEIVGWGAGIVVGTIAATILFIGPLAPDKK